MVNPLQKTEVIEGSLEVLLGSIRSYSIVKKYFKEVTSIVLLLSRRDKIEDTRLVFTSYHNVCAI